MKLCRCPICHSDLHLEALMEDDAGRELLTTITAMTDGCSRPVVSYLGLFKPAKSTLSNSRALKILRDLLDLYPCSNLLAHSLSETVEQVRKNRRENGRIEPLVNHNYLKKVYESNRPNFAVVRSAKEKLSSQEQQIRQQEDERANRIAFVDRFVRLQGEEKCQHLHGFDEWKQWQQEKQNATTN